MDFQKILRALLTNVYKKSDGEIDALLTASEATEDSALSGILEIDRARVANLQQPKQGQTFQDGYKKAKAEVLTAFEKEVKEKYGIADEDANNPITGIDLVAAVIAKEAPTSSKLTDDEVKKHPIFLQLERAKRDELKKVTEEWQQKYDERETQIKKTQTLGAVNKKALDILGSLKPIFSKNATVAENQKQAWLAQFQGYEFQEAEDGSVTILKDGKRLEDGHGYAKSFDAFVKESANAYFDFEVNNGGGNGGNGGAGGGGNEGGGKNYPAGITKPTNLEELTKIMNDPQLKTEDKRAVMDTWKADNANTKE